MTYRKEDRLMAATLPSVTWFREIDRDEDAPSFLEREAKRRMVRPLVLCRSAARELVTTEVVIEEVKGSRSALRWQPKGEFATVVTSAADLMAMLGARVAAFEAARQDQGTLCRGCQGRLATGSLIWEAPLGGIYCERCYRSRQVHGASLRAYCRADDWGEGASAAARKRLGKAVEQVIGFENSLSTLLKGTGQQTVV